MCIDTITVDDVLTQRDAYEVSEYLRGHPAIDDVELDMFEKELIVDYNEERLSHSELLDEIEHAGCSPRERNTGFVNRLKRAAGV